MIRGERAAKVTDDGAAFDREVLIDAASLRPVVTCAHRGGAR